MCQRNKGLQGADLVANVLESRQLSWAERHDRTEIGSDSAVQNSLIATVHQGSVASLCCLLLSICCMLNEAGQQQQDRKQEQ